MVVDASGIDLRHVCVKMRKQQHRAAIARTSVVRGSQGVNHASEVAKSAIYGGAESAGLRGIRVCATT